MDITALLGDAFGACVYVAYYTSKKDKSADLHKIIRKIEHMEFSSNEQELKRNLNRILLAIDSCKATGAPEAASNILGHKHHFTSTNVHRILQKSFIQEAAEIQKDDKTSHKVKVETEDHQFERCLNTISKTFSEIAGSHPRFELPRTRNMEQEEDENPFTPQQNLHNRTTIQYMERPPALESISHQDYFQSYKVHPRPRKK